jgi:hypothetical protein
MPPARPAKPITIATTMLKNLLETVRDWRVVFIPNMTMRPLPECKSATNATRSVSLDFERER